MTSLFNQSQNIKNNNTQQIQTFTEYPDVFFTQGQKQQTSILSTPQPPHTRKGLLGNLNISKDLISQFLPLLFGNSGNSDILSNLLQSGIMQSGKNNILSNLFDKNNDSSQIFNTLNSLKKTENKKEKKDISNLIDMSDYIEI